MEFDVGSILEGKVTGITKFGAFVELPGGRTGMVHISEVAATFVKEIRDYVSENQTIKVKILNISEDGKISLSMKRAVDPPPRTGNSAPRQQRPGRPGSYEWQSRRNEGGTFEEMMSRFKQTSDEKMSDLKRAGNEFRRGYSRRGQQKG